jgi:hypothetical protein
VLVATKWDTNIGLFRVLKYCRSDSYTEGGIQYSLSKMIHSLAMAHSLLYSSHLILIFVFPQISSPPLFTTSTPLNSITSLMKMNSTASSKLGDTSVFGYLNIQPAPLLLIQSQRGVNNFSGGCKIWPNSNAKTPGQADVLVHEMNRAILRIRLVRSRVKKNGQL